MEKICFNTFFSFQKTKRKSTQKESNLAESTAIVDATRFIVTFGRVPLWKKTEVLLLPEKIMYFQERVGLITLQQTTSPGKASKFEIALTERKTWAKTTIKMSLTSKIKPYYLTISTISFLRLYILQKHVLSKP